MVNTYDESNLLTDIVCDMVKHIYNVKFVDEENNYEVTFKFDGKLFRKTLNNDQFKLIERVANEDINIDEVSC